MALALGCNKTESVDSTQLANDFLKENSIGYWHNEVLGVYYPEGRKIEQNSVVDHKAIRRDVISILNQKDPSRFVVKEMEALGEESELRLAEMGLPLDRPAEFAKQSFKVVDYLKNKGNISKKLYNKLSDIYAAETTNEALEKVNSIYLEKWSEQDKEYAVTFANVFKASHASWTSRQSHESSPRVNCNSAVILADAAGGLYGLLCGPACSIVEAAIFSLVAANGPACE